MTRNLLMPYLSLILLISAALSSGFTVLSLLITIRSRREYRNTIFPIVRETEGVKTRRAAIAAGVFLVLTALSIGGWVATQQNPDNVLQAREATQQARSQQTAAALVPDGEVTPEPALLSSKTEVTPEPADPSGSSKASASDSQAVNATIIVTVEPTRLFTTTPLSPQKTPAPPGLPEASIGPLTFASDVNERREAQNPTDVFDRKTTRVYAVFPYQGMKDGLPFSVIWYYQNIEFARDDFEWDWGRRGQSYFFVRPRNAGSYRVEFKIGDEVVADGSFEVTP